VTGTIFGRIVMLDVVDGGCDSVDPVLCDPSICWVVKSCFGRGFVDMGIRKALPMSLRVSLRARTFMLGATAGIWVGDWGSNPTSFRMRVMAVRRRSSTIVLSSRMATSTVSSLERRRLDLWERMEDSV
jgi:hypothetical protein